MADAGIFLDKKRIEHMKQSYCFSLPTVISWKVEKEFLVNNSHTWTCLTV